MAWLLRGIFGLGVLVLAFAALGSRAPSAPPAPAAPVATDTPLVLSTPTPVPQPTFTPEPFIQRVTSRIARETQAPYPTSTPPADGFVHVSAVDFGYMPSIVRIKAGQTVVWVNDGREEHDIVGSDWYSGAMEPTITYRETFGVPGTYNYRCSIHPDMVGSVIVSPP